jgi:hypothetical protein
VVSVEGELPAERRAHSAVISNGGHLCIFGGSDGTKRFDDIYSFDLSGTRAIACAGWGGGVILNFAVR